MGIKVVTSHMGGRKTHSKESERIGYKKFEKSESSLKSLPNNKNNDSKVVSPGCIQSVFGL